MSDFLAAEKGATRQQAIKAWARLKKLDVPKNYRSWTQAGAPASRVDPTLPLRWSSVHSGRRTANLRIRHTAIEGFESLVFGEDEDSGYRGVVAIHSTALGPAVGGVRTLSYPSHAAAVADALGLARAMSLKCALAGLPFGGGKSVIALDDGAAGSREAQLRAHGRLIDSLEGRYIAAEDVGTTPRDLEVVRQETRFVAGLLNGRAGDPAPYTARGVLRGIEAAVGLRLGAKTLAGCRVLIQGCGAVGSALASQATAVGAIVLLADVDEGRARRVADATGARLIHPDEIFGCQGDVLAPCALGGVLNDDTVPRLRVSIVAGAANNQLDGDGHEVALAARGIFYAPDFVINSGGLLSGMMDLLGWSADRTSAHIDGIGETLVRVWSVARERGVAMGAAAVALAQERLQGPPRPLPNRPPAAS